MRSTEAGSAGIALGTRRFAQIVHCKRETHLDRNRAVRSRSMDRGTGARDDRVDRAAIIGAALAIRAASFSLMFRQAVGNRGGKAENRLGRHPHRQKIEPLLLPSIAAVG